jgi:hypothetical protein
MIKKKEMMMMSGVSEIGKVRESTVGWKREENDV